MSILNKGMQALLTLNESFCTDTKRYSEYLWLVDRPGWCSPERLLLVVTDVCGWWLVDRPGWYSPEKDCCLL